MSKFDDTLDRPEEEASPPRGLSNAIAILVLGIVSIFWSGMIGFVLGIIAITMSISALSNYRAEPKTYPSSFYNLVLAGRICAIVGVCISAIKFGLFIYAVSSNMH